MDDSTHQGSRDPLLAASVHLDVAKRLLGCGTWEFALDTGVVRCSDEIYALVGIARETFLHSRKGYLSFVHPEDVAELQAQLDDYVADPGPRFSTSHRVVGADGSVRHVEATGELRESDGHRTLVGVLRDVTDRMTDARRIEDLKLLQRFAGETGRLGGWRVDLGAEHVLWTRECALIHDEPPGIRPTVEQAIAYYAPEDRPRIEEAFRRCVEDQVPYDLHLTVITAKGRRIAVRSTGDPILDDAGRVRAVHGAFQDISKIVAARKRVESLDQQLAHTLETMSDAFITLNAQGDFTFVNRQAEIALGTTREALLGKHIWEVYPQDPDSPFTRAYERTVRDRSTQTHVSWYALLRKWFSVICEPSGEGVAVFFRDVTEERRQTEHLRLLETAVSRLNDILLITEADPISSPDGPRIVFVNEAFVRHLGFSREEVIGRTPRMLQGERTSRESLDAIREALESREPVRVELLNYTRDGQEIWLDVDIVPILGADGEPTHFVAVERNITDRKQAEERARIANERFETIARATQDVIWDWDFHKDELWWSDGLLERFGYSPADFGSSFQAWEERIHEEDRERATASILNAVNGNADHWMDEYRFHHADGRVRIVIDRGSILRDDDGRAIRMVGSTIDVTEQREMQDRLRQSQKLEAVGQLTGGVSHDFNNLLTVILGNSELLVEELSEESGLRPMALATVSAAERGAELISRLLAFARKQPLEPRSVDINRLLQNTDRMLRRTLAANIHIETVAAAGLWLADVDPGQLEVALLNLALNSRAAMPDGGRLTIETANTRIDDDYAELHEEVSPGPYVLVSISDTGNGMPAEVAQRAFEPFFTTKRSGEGSGLGLSMVYGFVKQSGGHVKIYSEPGEGTTVKLYLPRSWSPEEETGDERSGSATGGCEHILVVEDDPHVRDHLTRQLTLLGYRVSAAPSGIEALALLDEVGPVDLLFTDVVMPGGMSGPELARAVLERCPEIRVLYTSGYTENAIVHQGRLDEGVHLLSKPYHRHELARKLRRVLDS